MAAFWRWQNALHAGKFFRCGEHARLLHGNGFHEAIIVKLGKNAAHAMVAQAASMICGRNEAGAKRIHFCERAYLARIAEIVNVLAAGQARAGSWLHCDEPIIPLSAQLFAHKRGDKAAQVGAAACAADDDIRLYAILIQCGFCFKTDDRLVQQYLGKHTAEHIAVAFGIHSNFHSFGNRAAQAAGGAGVLRENLASYFGRHGGGRRNACAIGAHNFAAERLLLIGDLHHVDLAIQIEIGAGHGERGAPLAGSSFRRNAFEALLLCIISLGNRGVKLVTAAGVVAFKLVIYFRRRAQVFLEAVGAHKRSRAVHFVEIADLIRDGDVSVGVIELLLNKLIAEHMAELFCRHGL